MRIKFFTIILTLLIFSASSIFAQEIKIGGLTDCTGATSDVGKDYALGLVEAFNYVNDTGGINGKRIKYTHRWRWWAGSNSDVGASGKSGCG